METFEVTKLSSKGQVVIPQYIRENLSLEPGNQFIIIGEGDTIVLKSIKKPAFKDFDKMIAKTNKFASENRITRVDLDMAIKKTRAKTK